MKDFSIIGGIIMNIKQDFLQLIKVCGNDAELLDFVEMSMNKMTAYVAKVAYMEYALPLYNARYEGQELRDKVQALDENRRIAHEAAISAVTSINRLAQSLNVEPLFKGDVTDRYQVADFCEQMVHDFFSDRSGVPEHKLNEYIQVTSSEQMVCVRYGDSVTQVTREKFEHELLDGNPYEPVSNSDFSHATPHLELER